MVDNRSVKLSKAKINKQLTQKQTLAACDKFYTDWNLGVLFC